MSDLLVWQLVDSAFPTGGFAHSWGLESAWQHGEISNQEELHRFVVDAVTQAGRSMLPFVRAAHEAPAKLALFDDHADAFLRNPVANRASRVQGRALLATAARVWPAAAFATLERQTDSLARHLAPMTGVVFRTLDVPLATTQRVLLFGTARGVLAAAVRLGVVGSYEAQRLQFRCAREVDRVVDTCGDLEITDIAQTAPIADMLQAAHDRLYSRLFQS